MQNFGYNDELMVQLERAGSTLSNIGKSDNLPLKGKYQIEHRDKDGNLKGIYDIPNGITNEGKNHALDALFHAATQITTWYIGLIDNSGFTALAATNTAAGINSTNGWNEFTTYTEGARQEWTEGAAASQSITNSTPATFSISGGGTVKGIFIVSSSTKSGTSGTLWSTALFASNIAVINGDSLKITYTVNAG